MSPNVQSKATKWIVKIEFLPYYLLTIHFMPYSEWT